MFTRSVCLFLAVTLVNGQIPSLGFCPEYLPINEFDMNRFLGKWYEAERYFTFTEVASRCVVTDYAKANSGRIYVSNEVTNRLTGVRRIINGNLQLVGKGDLGKLNVKYATSPIPTESTLTVLDTDYDNFAVVWSCTGFGPIHAQNAWLMTRDRLPTGSVLQKAYGILDKFKISRTFFVKTDQEGCAVAASDINAANGITSTSTIQEATGTDQRDGIVELKSVEQLDVNKTETADIKDVGVKEDYISNTASQNIKNEKTHFGQTENVEKVNLKQVDKTAVKTEEKKTDNNLENSERKKDTIKKQIEEENKKEEIKVEEREDKKEEIKLIKQDETVNVDKHVDENQEVMKEECEDKVGNESEFKNKEELVVMSGNQEQKQTIDEKKEENVVKSETENIVENVSKTNILSEKKETVEKKTITPDKFKLILEKQNIVLKVYDKVRTLESFKATEKSTQNKEKNEQREQSTESDESSSSEESSEETKSDETKNDRVETEKKAVGVAEHILKIKARNDKLTEDIRKEKEFNRF